MKLTAGYFVLLLLLLYYGYCRGSSTKTVVRNNWGPSKNSKCIAQHVSLGQGSSAGLQEELYYVNCSLRHITSIPVVLPVRVNLILKLDLSSNKIKQLHRHIFENFTKLRELHINKNPVESMSSFVFKGLVNLQYLWMSRFRVKYFLYQYENLHIEQPEELFSSMVNLHFLDLGGTCYNTNTLSTALSHISSKLTHLVMNRVFCVNATSSIWIVDDNFFRSLTHTRLAILSMRHNKIVLIKQGSVVLLPHLKAISLRNNLIYGDRGSLIDMTLLRNLTVLDIGKKRWPGESAPRRPNSYLNSYSFKPTFKSFFEITGKAPSKYKLKIEFLPNLRFVRIDNIAKTVTEINLIKWKICWKNNLLLLDISYTYLKRLIGTFWCMSSLRKLYMRGFRADQFDPQFFFEMPSLQILELSESSGSTILSNQSEKIFSKNTKLVRLNLSNIGVSWLPSKLFKALSKLEYLDISKNHLSSVRVRFKGLKSLTTLDISNNQIRHLDYGFVSQLHYIVTHRNHEKILTVKLQGNPLFCNCFILDPLTTLLTPKFRIAGFRYGRKRPTCTVSNGTETLLVDAVNFLAEECARDDMKPFLQFYIFLLVILLTCALAHRFRWRLLLLWYSLKQRTYKEGKTNYNFQYDAFVCYSNKDLNWVLHKLLPELGSQATHGHLGCRTGKFNFCLSDCHFVPGIPIVDNINHAISNSRYTVLYVTKDFIRSGWCRLEADLAQVSSVLGPQKVVMVLHPKVFQLKHLPKSIETLMKTVTCVEWPLLEQREKLFWLRLSEALQN